MTTLDTRQLTARIAPYVEMLYPDDDGAVLHALVELAQRYAAALAGREVAPPTERTACLITYGDGIRRRGEAPLHTLAAFLHDHVGDLLSDVHLLPMFPWTSDDGFAVVLAAAHADAVRDARRSAVLASLDRRLIRARLPHPGGSLLTDAGGSATTFLKCHTCSGRLVCQFTAAISSP